MELDAGDNTITFSNDSAYAPDIDLIRIATAVEDGGSTPPPPPPSGNLATSASVTCSYTSPWESCAVINSGDDPACSSIPGANQGTRWGGTWPETGSHWIELTWNDPVSVNQSEMYFFQDSTDGSNSGAKRPASWSIQYRSGSSWVNLPGASGYPTAVDHHLRGGHHHGAAGQPQHAERRRRCRGTGGSDRSTTDRPSPHGAGPRQRHAVTWVTVGHMTESTRTGPTRPGGSFPAWTHRA